MSFLLKQQSYLVYYRLPSAMLERGPEAPVPAHEFVGAQSIQQDPSIARIWNWFKMWPASDLSYTSCGEIQRHSETLYKGVKVRIIVVGNNSY